MCPYLKSCNRFVGDQLTSYRDRGELLAEAAMQSPIPTEPCIHFVMVIIVSGILLAGAYGRRRQRRTTRRPYWSTYAVLVRLSILQLTICMQFDIENTFHSKKKGICWRVPQHIAGSRVGIIVANCSRALADDDDNVVQHGAHTGQPMQWGLQFAAYNMCAIWYWRSIS